MRVSALWLLPLAAFRTTVRRAQWLRAQHDRRDRTYVRKPLRETPGNRAARRYQRGMR